MELLFTLEAADYCRLSPRTLEKKRVAGGGPPFVKLGRSVRYSKADLDAWMAQNQKSSTSDSAAHTAPDREPAAARSQAKHRRSKRRPQGTRSPRRSP